MSASTIVLYHGPHCPDGFAAAWCSSLALGRGPDVVYIPVNYGQPYPLEIDGGIARLFILDFSYPRATMEKLAGLADEIVCLDHHVTTQAELAGLPYTRFDMDKSGAMLAWEYFHPGEPVPYLVQLIQDRDLWQWKLPYSREISAYINLETKCFLDWDLLDKFVKDKDALNDIISNGMAILRAQQQYVESLASKAVFTQVGGYDVPTVNTPLFQSEVGEALCLKYPDAPFSATFFVLLKPDQYFAEETVWSLRSRNGFDVSVVAKSLGGGGHAAASGFVRKAEK